MPQITLKNRYQYNPDTDFLGEGGLGTVYKAYDNEHECYVAIKQFNVTGNLKYSLRDEFKKSIGFSHGNLVRAYDFFSTRFTDPNGQVHETQYGVMELIEGDLASYLQTRPALPELLEVVKGILYGLRYLHTRDPKTDKGVIIHRDIKPANILIYRNSQRQPIPKITDFNIAKEASTDLSTQTVVGTPEYMSPEQFLPKDYGANGKVQPNTDLWSLGVLLCDHLLKTSVFGKRSNGQTQGEITYNVLNKAVPTTEIQKLPAPFKQIITVCLVRHATQRIQSADALLTLINQKQPTIIGDTSPEKIYVPPRPVADTPQPKPIPKQTDYVLYIAGGAVLVVMLLLAWLINGGTLTGVVPKNDADTITQTLPADTTTTQPTPADDKSLANKAKQDSAKYANLVQEANVLYDQDKYKEAKAKYEAASKLQPNNTHIRTRIQDCDTKLQTANTTQPTTLTKPTAQQPSTQPPPPPPTTDPFAAQMVQVQGGTFMMGCTAEQDCDSDEKPAKSVTVGTFYISKYEVTQAQWQAIMGNNPSNFKGDNLPVELVSYNDIQTFLEKLNTQTGKSYRLPTEAEWEYAARGGSRSNGYKYAGSNSPSSVAWCGDSKGKTHTVGQKQANELGLYDMSGNVRECTNNLYDNNNYRVVRGGSWYYHHGLCRVSIRDVNLPDSRTCELGFRVSRRL